jgi:hypothetical protein
MGGRSFTRWHKTNQHPQVRVKRTRTTSDTQLKVLEGIL